MQSLKGNATNFQSNPHSQRIEVVNMSPLGVGSSDTNTLKTGQAKLWIFLVGVNNYQDASLPSLRYPAVDCQGLGEALAQATQGFPNKEVIVHNDFAAQPPTLKTVRRSLERIVSQSQSQDSILLYFSGHGMLEANNQQAVLCLSDTHKDDLLSTGLPLQELLQMLGTSSANQQLVCLDTCHSGDMRLVGGNGGSARSASSSQTLPNPTPQLMEVLRQRAAQSKGFCALLSCDQGQQSWEFPELGHGVFTYYLMQGLLGEAADAHGVIEADGLYKYVYRQTLQYINKLNHQLRLINQQKLQRGDSKLHPEYPLQTPKRIVEGVGELILGFKGESAKAETHKQRRALIVDGLENKKTTANLTRMFSGAGDFEVECFPQAGKSWSEIRGTIQGFLRWRSESATESPGALGAGKNTATSLLYLRGQIEEIEDGEAWLILGDGVRLSRSWLRQELRRAGNTQQIIILDCPEAAYLENWIEDLQSGVEHGQCLIAAASTPEEPELFFQTLLVNLVAANPQVGLSVAKLIADLQPQLQAKGVNFHSWLSGTQAVIDILPGGIAKVLPNFQELEEPLVEEKQEVPSTPSPSHQLSSENSASVVSSASTNKIQPQSNFTLAPEAHTKLEQLLKQSIGLIAPVILRKAVTNSADCNELLEKLAAYLLPEQQEHFKEQATAILEQYPVASSDDSGKLPTIDAKFISQCERELTYSVGPIAGFMVQKVLKSHPQISLAELVNTLAEKIPNPQQALEFKQRMQVIGNR
jgi:uncharacterized caspase-like protein